MSMVPMGGNKMSANPTVIEQRPGIYLSMGLTAERLARHYGIGREEADAFAYRSHRNALAAQAAGHFDDEIIPVTACTVVPDEKGRPKASQLDFHVDEGPRADTSLEALGKLKPVFHARGTVTAGNSSQMSD